MVEKQGGKKANKKQTTTMQKRLAGMKVWQLLVLLLVVVGGTVFFVGAASGWFSSSKVVLDAEYYCDEECDGEFLELSGTEYEELVKEEKSFVVFVDQSGCTTADRLREYVKDWADDVGVRAYKMMFAEARETPLHDYVKYYPSVVLVSKGKVIRFLRADSDEDAKMYNDFDAFKKWILKYL